MYKIAVLPGDGIGEEVVREGVKVLGKIAEVCGFDFETVNYPFGADHYLVTKELLPDSALNEMKEMDAILLGAIGDPRFETGFLERGIVGAIRFRLDLYVNLRPIKLYSERICPLKDKKPEDINFIVVRENTEDIYLGIGGFFKKGTPDEIAVQEVIYTRKGVERVIRYAYELCRKRAHKKKITLCDKANAVQAHDLWRRTFEEVGKEYPDIERDFAFVDAMTMWMVKNPQAFDVIVTTNMFGDIITDLGAMLQGGLGVAAGGNIHPGRVSMFEPIHGSAPKYKGQNKANPLATILSVSMMLEHLGENKASALIENSVKHAIVSGKIPDLSASSGLKTTEIGDIIVSTIENLAKQESTISR